jgi:hypothetical protein
LSATTLARFDKSRIGAIFYLRARESFKNSKRKKLERANNLEREKPQSEFKTNILALLFTEWGPLKNRDGRSPDPHSAHTIR